MFFLSLANNAPWYLDPVFLPAATGLFGVVIGGLITAGSTYLLDIRREQREIAKDESDRAAELKKAARLVFSDLLAGSVAINRTIEASTYYRHPHDTLADNSWATYRPFLAATLSNEQWDNLTVGIVTLSSFKGLRDSAVERGKVVVGSDDAEDLRGLKSEIQIALKALEPFI